MSCLSHHPILKPSCCPSYCLHLLFQTEHVWMNHWLLPKEQPLSSVAGHWKRPLSSLSSPGMQGWSQTLQHQKSPSALLQGGKWIADSNTTPNPSLQRFRCILLWFLQMRTDEMQAGTDTAILLLLQPEAKHTPSLQLHDSISLRDWDKYFSLTSAFCTGTSAFTCLTGILLWMHFNKDFDPSYN